MFTVIGLPRFLNGLRVDRVTPLQDSRLDQKFFHFPTFIKTTRNFHPMQLLAANSFEWNHKKLTLGFWLVANKTNKHYSIFLPSTLKFERKKKANSLQHFFLFMICLNFSGFSQHSLNFRGFLDKDISSKLWFRVLKIQVESNGV